MPTKSCFRFIAAVAFSVYSSCQSIFCGADKMLGLLLRRFFQQLYAVAT
jgi:hypothetical protein